jgi:hypothetical protein
MYYSGNYCEKLVMDATLEKDYVRYCPFPEKDIYSHDILGAVSAPS